MYIRYPFVFIVRAGEHQFPRKWKTAQRIRGEESQGNSAQRIGKGKEGKRREEFPGDDGERSRGRRRERH